MSSENQEKRDIGKLNGSSPADSQKYSWYKWRSAEQLQTKSSFYTDDFYTSGDGYVVDFSLTLSSEQFRSQINELLSNSNPPYIDENTGVIIIGFNCYDPSQDRFITTSMTIHFSMSGMLVPYPIKIISYAWDQMKQTSSMAMLIDIIQMFFCFCYFIRATCLKMKLHEPIIRLLSRLCTKSKKTEDDPDVDGSVEKMMDFEEEKQEEEIEGYSPTCSVITDLIVVLCYFLKFSFSQETNYHDIKGLLNDNYNGYTGEQYVEMTHYADYYLEQYQMYTLIIIFNIYNLLGSLRIFRLIHWIMLIVEGSFDLVKNFMMLLLPMQLGFSFISLVFVGPYVKKYDSITNGFKQQIITMMGQ